MTKRRQRYTVEYRRAALRELGRLPLKQREKVVDRIDALEMNPRPRGSKLTGYVDLYRIRSGVYRVVYQLSDDPPLVTIARVRHRRDAYLRL